MRPREEVNTTFNTVERKLIVTYLREKLPTGQMSLKFVVLSVVDTGEFQMEKVVVFLEERKEGGKEALQRNVPLPRLNKLTRLIGCRVYKQRLLRKLWQALLQVEQL